MNHRLSNNYTSKRPANLVQTSDELLYIDKIQPSHRLGLQMSSHIGYRAPLHCTALGKVLLVHQPPAEVDRVIKAIGLTRRTADTITDVDMFKSHLELVKKEGYALDG